MAGKKMASSSAKKPTAKPKFGTAAFNKLHGVGQFSKKSKSK